MSLLQSNAKVIRINGGGGSKEYSAGKNISITDDVISLNDAVILGDYTGEFSILAPNETYFVNGDEEVSLYSKGMWVYDDASGTSAAYTTTGSYLTDGNSGRAVFSRDYINLIGNNASVTMAIDGSAHADVSSDGYIMVQSGNSNTANRTIITTDDVVVRNNEVEYSLTAIGTNSGLTSVATDGNITGNGVTPLGLSSMIVLTAWPGGYITAGADTTGNFTRMCSAGIDVYNTGSGGNQHGHFGPGFDCQYNAGNNYVTTVATKSGGMSIKWNGAPGISAQLNYNGVILQDNYGTESARATDIRKWNSAYDQIGNITALLDSI